MRKFDPQKEIRKANSSILENAFIPFLVVGCACLAMVGVAFSYKVVSLSANYYDIDFMIVGGNQENYHKRVTEGSFNDTLTSDAKFDHIYCEKGDAQYNIVTQSIEIPYVNSDVKCTIYFKDDSAKYLTIDEMYSINDNSGTSYYYKGDTNNNYFKINDLMFRIVRINGNGTLRLILDESNLSFNYGINTFYDESNLRMVLHQWFKENLEGNDNIVIGDFDISSYDSIDISSLINLDYVYQDYVGTLSALEASLIVLSENNYLGDMLLLNGTANGKVFAVKNNRVVPVGINEDMVIKPVINVKKSSYSGLGTIDVPYVIKED